MTANSVLVLNGPNLARLGNREPDIYGRQDYSELVRRCIAAGRQHRLEIEVRQTDSESELVAWLDQAAENETPVILNAAAFTHYSLAVAEACRRRTAPLIEVHLSNPHAREAFRQRSVITEFASGTIAGFGIASYELAISAMSGMLERK